MGVNRKSKNAIFDFNIDVEKMLKRPRVDEFFKEGLNFPITIVHAPAGYGKTTAALQFAKSLKAQIVYMSLNELDKNPQYFWNHLSKLYVQVSTQIGVKLAQLGFPTSIGSFTQFIDLFGEIAIIQKHILIIDDFHIAEGAELEEFLVKVSGTRKKNLNILILSRTLPRICSVDMKVKGLIHEITKENLKFDQTELLAYYNENKIKIGEDTVLKIGQFTEGWASAVYLSSLYYSQNPNEIFNIAIFDINRLIENTVYKGYNDEVKDFLLKLSILNRFDIEVCTYLTGKKNTFELLTLILTENSLIKISEDKQSFEMHRLFRDFLQNKLANQKDIDKKLLHIRAGEYFEYKNDILMALLHFDCAMEFEKAVNLIIRNKCTATFSNQELESILNYMLKIPNEYFLKNPMFFLVLAMSLTRTKHAAKSLELIKEVERLCEDQNMSLDFRNKLLGEASVIKALMSFNNTSKMLVHFKEACRLLNNGTELVGANWSYTFGCPSMLYLYYYGEGALDSMLDIFLRGFKYWEKLSSCGRGADYLLKAEVFYERGDFESAEQDSYRAIYRAEEQNQNSIVIAAKFLIIKICAARGKYSNAALMLRDLRELADNRKSLIYLSTIDMCSAVFYLICGDLESIPKWLYEGNLTTSAANRAGFGIEFLIYTHVLLCNEQYLKIESIIPKLFETYAMFTNQYGIIRTHIIEAVTNYHLYGIDKAVRSINLAFKITELDELIMPYLENGGFLLPLFKEIANNFEKFDFAFSRKWVENTTKQMTEYQNSVSKFRAGFNTAYPEKTISGKVRLTKREAEILRLIVDGYSGQEISKKLYVTPINIRVITSKIYRKLGVNSRVEAVKAVMDNGLI